MPAFRLRVRTTEIDLPLGELAVGRATDCFLRIDDDLVSRRHARLVVGEAQVMFEDLGSRNGSRVNGVRCTTPVELRLGDSFEIGTQMFQLITGTPTAPRDETMTMLPHRGCAECGQLFDTREHRCPHCGADQGDEVTSVRDRRDPTVPLPGERPTTDERRAFAPSFAMVAAVADKLLAMGRVDEAEKMMGPRLREALSRCHAGERFEARVSDEVLARGARLATVTGRDEWYEWTFTFAQQAGRRLDPRVLDDLHAAMLLHKPAAGASLFALFQAQRADDPDTAQYRLRLEALLRFCRPS